MSVRRGSTKNLPLCLIRNRRKGKTHDRLVHHPWSYWLCMGCCGFLGPSIRQAELWRGPLMSKPWITSPRDRLSRKFATLHKQLAKEVRQPPISEKTARKRQASHDYRTRGAE